MKNFYIFIFLVSSIIISTESFGQKETNHWYFGAQAGLDFNTPAPVVDNNGRMNASEGCSIASDRVTGALKFYTNGTTVWGANHTIMSNGSNLNGNGSSAQSCVIVPVPCSDSLYYIFHTDANENTFTNGLQYTMVDMSLNGGNGDVMASAKNVPLIAPACEKVAAVHADNGQDFWVVTIEQATNKFYAYKVTASGVAAPVITTIGWVYTGSSAPRAYLKFSPDGKRLFSVVGWNSGSAELFDFDDATGVISNRLVLSSTMYGASFSPDSKLLYTSSSTDIYQFDLSSGVASTIIASRQTVGTVSGGLVRALQLGIDGRIYLADFAKTYIHSIDNPNVLGVGCNFSQASVNLGKTIMLGLPNFVESYFDTTYAYVPCSIVASANSTTSNCKNCTGTATATPLGGTAPYTYSWATTPVQTTQTITGLCPGTYTVTITDVNNFTSTATVTVSPTPPPTVTAGPTLTLTCTTTSGTITATTSSVVSYSWSGPGIVSGGNTSTPTVNMQGTYSVTVTDTATGCTNSTTVLVNKDTIPPTVTTTGLTLSCITTSGTLSATANPTNSTYSWTGPNVISGNTTSTPTIGGAGTYTVVVTNPSNGCTNTTVATVNNAPLPVAGVSPNITITNGDSTTLNATGGTVYNWSPSTGLSCTNCSSPVAKPTQTTTYCVIVSDSTGCFDTTCVIVTVKELCLDFKDAPIPNVFSPNNDGSNDYFYLTGNWEGCAENFVITVFDRWGLKVYESKNPAFSWNGNTLNGKKVVDGTYYYTIDFTNADTQEKEKISGFISVVR